MNKINRFHYYWTSRPDTFFLSSIEQLQGYTSPDIKLDYEPHPDLHGLVYLKISHDVAQQLIGILKSELDNCDKEQEEGDYHQINELIESLTIYISEKPITKDAFLSKQNYIDLDEATYADFVSFLNHKNVLNPQAETYQYKIDFPKNWIEGNFNKLVSHYLAFFDSVNKWKASYTDDELNHLLNFIFGYPFGVKECIFNSELDFNERTSLIKSIYSLYEYLFIDNEVEHHRHMLWDGIAYSYTTNYFPPSFDVNEKEHIRNAMFETLQKILELPSIECQFAALHGLNHLRHKETEQVVMQYIKENPTLSEEEIYYAKAYMRFEMM